MILKDRNVGKEVIIFNTYLDHKSEKARQKGIELIEDNMLKLEDIPVILMGDLNFAGNTDLYKSIMNKFIDTKYVA